MIPDVKLTEYAQRIAIVGGDATYTPVEFNNLPALVVRANATVAVLRQSGRGVAWFAKFKVPDPVVVSPVFLEKPKREYHRVEDKPWAWESTWEYVMAVDATFLLTFDRFAAEAWPAAPVYL